MKYIFLLLILFAIACSPKEKVVNPVKENRTFMISTDLGGYSLKGIDVPSAKLNEEDFFRKIFQIEAKSSITTIADNGMDIFFFMPDEMKIFVADKKDMSQKAIIDFSARNLKPVSVTFPNATDAYIIHREASDVSIVDLTVYEIARTIKCGVRPAAIASNGNQVYVADSRGNAVHVIDTRTRAVEATIPVQSGPSFIRFSNDGKSAIVVSTGISGTGDDATKTAATITFINKETRSITSSTELGFGQISPIEQLPIGFEITLNDWGFIPTQIGLLRVDLRSPDKISLMNRLALTGIAYYRDENELILYISGSSSDIYLADDSRADIKESLKFQGRIFAIYPQ